MVVNSPLAPTVGVAVNYSGRATLRILFCGLLLCPLRSLLTPIASDVNGDVAVDKIAKLTSAPDRGGMTLRCYVFNGVGDPFRGNVAARK